MQTTQRFWPQFFSFCSLGAFQALVSWAYQRQSLISLSPVENLSVIRYKQSSSRDLRWRRISTMKNKLPLVVLQMKLVIMLLCLAACLTRLNPNRSCHLYFPEMPMVTIIAPFENSASTTPDACSNQCIFQCNYLTRLALYIATKDCRMQDRTEYGGTSKLWDGQRRFVFYYQGTISKYRPEYSGLSQPGEAKGVQCPVSLQ